MAKQRFVPYRVYVCFGDIDHAVPWEKLGYTAWHERAAAYKRAGIRQMQCSTCRRYFWPDEKHEHAKVLP